MKPQKPGPKPEPPKPRRSEDSNLVTCLWHSAPSRTCDGVRHAENARKSAPGAASHGEGPAQAARPAGPFPISPPALVSGPRGRKLCFV